MVVICLKPLSFGVLALLGRICGEHAFGNQESWFWRGSRHWEEAHRGFQGVWNVLDLCGGYTTVFIS